ncbi:MAG TPA: hypothetical protein VM533_01435 [Fimbriiglobus sp.]|jgi:hypothetical protein|nr:hypothetical protein [Fimbriiglobus sp.]
MRFVALIPVVAVLAGCGGVRTASVEGKLVWADGAPAKELSGGLVMFQTADGGTKMRGVIGPDGAFTLAEAVPVGVYQVYVVETLPVVRETGDGDELGPPKMDPKYGDPKTSGLTAPVESGGEPVVLKVARAGKRR